MIKNNIRYTCIVDETDLCLRMVDAAGGIQAPDAFGVELAAVDGTIHSTVV